MPSGRYRLRTALIEVYSVVDEWPSIASFLGERVRDISLSLPTERRVGRFYKTATTSKPSFTQQETQESGF